MAKYEIAIIELSAKVDTVRAMNFLYKHNRNIACARTIYGSACQRHALGVGLRGLRKENERLHKLFDFKTKHPALKLVPARVIGDDISPFFRTLKIRLVGKPVGPESL